MSAYLLMGGCSLNPGTSLVQTLCHLGPELTSDPEVVVALLRRFGVSESSPPREIQVSEILLTLSRYAVEGSQLCDVGALVKAICSLVSITCAPAVILVRYHSWFLPSVGQC